jgi:hypothetical protein
MVMRSDPWNTRSSVSRWAHLFERAGLALAGGSCGLFVAAEVARTNVDLLGSGASILVMLVYGAAGFYLGIDLPPPAPSPGAAAVTAQSRLQSGCGGVAQRSRYFPCRGSRGRVRLRHHSGRGYGRERYFPDRRQLGDRHNDANCRRHHRANASRRSHHILATAGPIRCCHPTLYQWPY